MGNVNTLCRKLREEAGLTRKELADLFGYTPEAVKAIENEGERTMSLETAKKYAEVFGEKYFDELSAPLVRYDCAEKIGELLKEKGVSLSRFAKVIRRSEFTVKNTIAGYKRANGSPMHSFTDEEITALASYFHTSSDVFKTKKILVGRRGGRSDSGWIPMPTNSEPAPIQKPVRKTAQMICEEEKKMEYEEALKKAKDFDILKEENDHLKKDCDEWSMMYNAARGRIDELEKDNERYKKSLDEVYTEIKEYKNIAKERDKAVEAYDNLSNLYGSLSKEAKEKDALINELGRINRDLKKKVDSVDYSLASDYKTVSAELAKYKDILLEILLEQRNAK